MAQKKLPNKFVYMTFKKCPNLVTLTARILGREKWGLRLAWRLCLNLSITSAKKFTKKVCLELRIPGYGVDDSLQKLSQIESIPNNFFG